MAASIQHIAPRPSSSILERKRGGKEKVRRDRGKLKEERKEKMRGQRRNVYGGKIRKGLK